MEHDGSVTPRGRGLLILGSVLAVGAVVALAWWARAPRRPGGISIAVLPLENRSPAPENAWLAAGIQDELINLLGRVGPLRVTSRTAVQRYAGTAATPRIGRELGVSYLLSGGVKRDGDVLRIEVALLDADDDRRVWESRFERHAADVFAVESEVAQSVAEALQGGRLSPGERNALLDPPTPNPAAYQAYLHARSFLERTVRTEGEIRDVIAAYEDAVRLDPKFAAAWAQLSRRQSSFYSLGYDRSDARRDAALQAVETAERLAPELIDTKTARAYYLFVVKQDLEGAERAVHALEARNPSSPDIATGLAQITRELGRLDRSAEYARRAIQLDPLNPYRQYQLCQDYLTSREFVLAAQTCDGAHDLLPGDIGILTLQAAIRQARGELAASRALLRGLAAEPGDTRALRILSRQLELDRDPRGASALLGKALASPDALATRIGIVRRWLADAQRLAGDADAAHASYEAARVELEAELARQPANPLFLGELATVLARLGNRDAANEWARRCARFAQDSRRSGYIGDCGLARIQVALAAEDSAGLPALLEEALKQRGSLPPLTVNLIRVDPDFDAHRALIRTLTPD